MKEKGGDGEVRLLLVLFLLLLLLPLFSLSSSLPRSLGVWMSVFFFFDKLTFISSKYPKGFHLVSIYKIFPHLF